MPLPAFILTTNTFGDWVNTTNQIITSVGNTSEHILVAQNATPLVTTGNVSINGTMTLGGLSANGSLGIAGQFLTSNGTKIYWSTLTVVDANSSTSGLVNTSTQTFAGLKTFQNSVTMSAASNALGTFGVGGAFSALSTLTTSGLSVFNANVSANSTVTYNTTNGRLILPVGADKWG